MPDMGSSPGGKSSTPLVSVIVPTYNRAGYLRKALQSVTAQTYPHWECVVVDDGSTDETESVVRDAFGQRVRYRRQENAGPSVARNHGIEAARGDLLLFLDSDDLLVPDAIECLWRHLQVHPEAEVAYGGFYVLLPEGNLLANERTGTPRLSESAERFPPGIDENEGAEAAPFGLSAAGAILPQLLQHDALLMGTALLRRSAVEAVGGFDPSLPRKEHWDFALRVARTGAHFIPANRPVLLLRRHEGNRSRNVEESLSTQIQLIDEHLPDDDPDASELRDAAYAHAYMGAATFLLYQDRLHGALECLGRALTGAVLSLDNHVNDLDVATQKICAEATSTDRPSRRLASLLEPFTGSVNRRAFRHFVWSRFRRMRARRAARAVTSTRPTTWPHAVEALVNGGRSGVQLGAAVAHDWSLSRTYWERIRRWMGVEERGRRET